MALIKDERERERELFKTFTKFELPLFMGQILQLLLHCNTRVGGWEFPQDSFYLFCIFLFGNTITFCIIELFAIMPSYVLYNMDILCYNLLCFARICTLLRVYAIKWYPTTNA